MAKKISKPEIDETQEHDEELDHESDSMLGDPQITKAEAARRTLAEGIELPRKATIHIKEKYNLDVTPQQFSAEKSRLKLRSGGVLPGNSFRSPGRLDAYAAPPTHYSDSDPGLLEALEAIKPLVESLGPDKVKRMVDLLG